jgi:hypothetical protein
LFGDGDNGWLQEMRRQHYPPERNRVPAHLTLFRQLPPSLGAELNGRLAALARRAPPKAAIAGVIDLGEGTALRVDSDELEEIREDLASALHGLLIPQDLAPWRPHITVQNKVEPREARQLQQRLRSELHARPLAVRGLGTRRYLDGPWETIRDFVFRG